MRSAPSIPVRISRCQGQIPNDSGLGQGMCQNKATLASGFSFFISSGSRAK
jgi:hypothetical protein